MRKSPLLLPPLVLLTLAACATPHPSETLTPTLATSAAPASACAAFKRLTFDRLKDTDETIRGIKDQNAARDALCGGGK